MLKQAPSENRLASNSNVRLLAKKKIFAIQPTKKAPTLSPTFPSTSASFVASFSSVANTKQDLSTASFSIGIELETEVEPVVPRIVCKEEEKEDMAANLRVGF